MIYIICGIIWAIGITLILFLGGLYASEEERNDIIVPSIFWPLILVVIMIVGCVWLISRIFLFPMWVGTKMKQFYDKKKKIKKLKLDEIKEIEKREDLDFKTNANSHYRKPAMICTKCNR